MMLEWNNKGRLGQQTPVSVVPLNVVTPMPIAQCAAGSKWNAEKGVCEKKISPVVWVAGGAVALGALYFLLR